MSRDAMDSSKNEHRSNIEFFSCDFIRDSDIKVEPEDVDVAVVCVSLKTEPKSSDEENVSGSFIEEKMDVRSVKDEPCDFKMEPKPGNFQLPESCHSTVDCNCDPNSASQNTENFLSIKMKYNDGDEAQSSCEDNFNKITSTVKMMPENLHCSVCSMFDCVCYKANPSNPHSVNRIRTSEKTFKCKICSKSFFQSADLSRHIRTHTGEKPFQCNICGKFFAQKPHLVQHIQTHTGEKPFQCEICKKLFTRKPNLNQHIRRTHTGEKRFHCNVCNKSFSLNSDVNMHLRTHTGEKPFQCDICNKCFSQKTHLSQHIQTHTGEKPFQCTICNKSFSRNTFLNQHIRTHTREKFFKCNICNEFFSHKTHLNQHIRTHIGVNFQCGICNELFSCEPSLNLHIQNHLK